MRCFALLISLFSFSVLIADEEVALLGKKCPKPLVCPPSKECPKEPPPPPCPPKPMPCKPDDQGDDPLPNDQYLPSYNAPAAVALKNQIANFYVDGSYIFWNAIEEGLDLAQAGTLSGGQFVFNQGVILEQPFSYQSGFKVALGVQGNSAKADATYTWVRQRTTVSSALPPAVAGATSIWAPSNWFVDNAIIGTSISSDWHLGLDLFDLTFGRSYYQGRSVTVFPYFGIRGDLIRQYLAIDIAESASRPLVSGETTATSHNLCQSWGIGPRTGVSVSYLGYLNLRIIGNAAVSALFTRYTSIANKSDITTSSQSSFANATFSDRMTNVNTVRPVLDLGLGLGWGGYTPSQNLHFDIAVTYDFVVFWNQNMMRALADEWAVDVGSSPSNLYLQGLTVTAGIAF